MNSIIHCNTSYTAIQIRNNYYSTIETINIFLDHKKAGGLNIKKWVGQKTWWVNKLGESNTKLDRPVPSRPTHSTATAAASITLLIINNVISSDPNSFIIEIILLS